MKLLSELLADELPLEPTKDQFHTWRQSPVTQWISADLRVKHQMLLEDAITSAPENLHYYQGQLRSVEDFIAFLEAKNE